jgi:hypothetical protein
VSNGSCTHPFPVSRGVRLQSGYVLGCTGNLAAHRRRFPGADILSDEFKPPRTPTHPESRVGGSGWLLERQRARDTANVAATLRSFCRCDVVASDDVADTNAPARTEHPAYLREHSALVYRQVDDTFGYDNVDGVGGQWDLFDVTP